MNDNAEAEPKTSLVWVLFTVVAMLFAIGGAAYIAGKLLRGMLT